MNIHLIADIDSLKKSVTWTKRGMLFDFAAIVKQLSEDYTIVAQSAYSAKGYQVKFLDFLRHNGYNAFFNRANYMVDIAIEVGKSKAPAFVFLTDNKAFAPIMETLKREGKPAFIFGVNPHIDLHRYDPCPVSDDCFTPRVYEATNSAK